MDRFRNPLAGQYDDMGSCGLDGLCAPALRQNNREGRGSSDPTFRKTTDADLQETRTSMAFRVAWSRGLGIADLDLGVLGWSDSDMARSKVLGGNGYESARAQG